jgi:DNA-binding winged helix-turn-helix (wHTH) protein
MSDHLLLTRPAFHFSETVGSLVGQATFAPPTPAEPTTLRFGRCEVRPAWREVRIDGQLVALQPRPFDLLLHLITHRHRVVRSDELLDAVWGDEAVAPASLAAAVARVRRALCEGEPGIGKIIRTFPKVGYRFVARIEDTV